MVVKHWSLPNLSELFNRQSQNKIVDTSHSDSFRWNQALSKAEAEWSGAIAAVEELLLSRIKEDCPAQQYQGLLLSGPAPILSHPALISQLCIGVFTNEAFDKISLTPFQLPGSTRVEIESNSSGFVELPLLPNDPIAYERYGLLFTNEFSLAIVLGQDNVGLPAFHFSFEPELIKQIWANLRTRLLLTNHESLGKFDELIAKFEPHDPDYRLVTQFSRALLDNLRVKTPSPVAKEIELLQALTHEIRTPLTTIRTWTRLLLKRAQLTPKVMKRLEMIEQECTEQINRMELIFKATELEGKALEQPIQLIPISLEQLFQENIPRWQKQAQRRNVVLEVILPKQFPTILGDPAMLEQVLSGLIEKFTRSLSTGGKITVEVMTVGNQLKLQFLSISNYPINPLKSLGQLLMFQPETGSLSLNLDVTKNLFQIMGGKLTVKQKQQTEEVLTIFLPLKNTYQVSMAQEQF